jgi:hypothetical protein
MTVLATAHAERLEAIAKDIETTHTNAVLHIAAQLAEARNIFRYRHDEGGFGGWVETRLSYSRSTAYNLLNVHERFGGENNLSKCLDTFPRSVLYRLAAPSTPQEAVDEIVERAEAGEPVPSAEVERVIATVKGKKATRKSKSAAEDKPALYCSFCNKSQHDVHILIVACGLAPRICDECVAMCADLIVKEKTARPPLPDDGARHSENPAAHQT